MLEVARTPEYHVYSVIDNTKDSNSCNLTGVAMKVIIKRTVKVIMTMTIVLIVTEATFTPIIN